jgi:hypothetical protein
MDYDAERQDSLAPRGSIAAPGGMNCSAPFLLGTLAGDVFTKHSVHSRLPTFTRGFEVGDDLGAVPYGNEQPLAFGFWPRLVTQRRDEATTDG